MMVEREWPGVRKGGRAINVEVRTLSTNTERKKMGMGVIIMEVEAPGIRRELGNRDDKVGMHMRRFRNGGMHNEAESVSHDHFADGEQDMSSSTQGKLKLKNNNKNNLSGSPQGFIHIQPIKLFSMPPFTSSRLPEVHEIIKKAQHTTKRAKPHFASRKK